MFTSHRHNKKLILSTLISLVAAFLFITHPLFAQTTLPPVSPNSPNVNEQNGNNNDFDNDVNEGKNELKNDSQAQEFQKEVLDVEDEQAGDEEDNDINENSNLQEADNQQGIDEADQDNNNSEIDEVDDANNLDEQSQTIINEHDQQDEQEIDQEEQNIQQEDQNQKDLLPPEQTQSETPDTNQ